jgi:NADH:ubiquinone oxidoreductase 27 kD subunit
MIDNVTHISIDTLLGFVQDMIYSGHRFITATCVDNGDGTKDLLYHFDKNLEMKHARITVGKDDEIPSISGIYFCAILVENEIKELFGVNIKNIAVDYGGHMLLNDDELEAPMSRQITIIHKGRSANE